MMGLCSLIQAHRHLNLPLPGAWTAERSHRQHAQVMKSKLLSGMALRAKPVFSHLCH